MKPMSPSTSKPLWRARMTEWADEIAKRLISDSDLQQNIARELRMTHNAALHQAAQKVRALIAHTASAERANTLGQFPLAVFATNGLSSGPKADSPFMSRFIKALKPLPGSKSTIGTRPTT